MSDRMRTDLADAIRREFNDYATRSDWLIDRIDRVGPLWACLTYGHPRQPKRRLGRFRTRPWRCPRCATWWVTEQHLHPEGAAWLWEQVEP